MASAHEIARTHMAAALVEAEAQNIPGDVMGRAFLEKVLDLYRQSRSPEDIASELQFHIDNLDPEGDQIFMRP